MRGFRALATLFDYQLGDPRYPRRQYATGIAALAGITDAVNQTAVDGGGTRTPRAPQDRERGFIFHR